MRPEPAIVFFYDFSEKKTCGERGTPVFAGTRVAVKTLFDYLETTSLEDFLEGHPTVSREQAETAVLAMPFLKIDEIIVLL